MLAIRLAFLSILLQVPIFIPLLSQDRLDSVCDTPSALFAEYNPTDDTIAIQCLNLAGEMETLLQDAGVGSLSPNGNYIAYTTTNSLGTSPFEYDMSLFLYEIDTGNTHRLQDSQGHINTIWTLANELIISTWDDRITTYAAYEPDHRFLYDPKSSVFVELNWPVGNGAKVVGYWSDENSFLFANYSDGLVLISEDGTYSPIPLPVQAFNSNFVMSPDGLSVAYEIQCEDDLISWACIAVYELGTGNVDTISAFAEAYEVLDYFMFSETGKYIAVSLDHNQAIGIYDLEQQEITFTLDEIDTSGFVWTRDQECLLIAVTDQDIVQNRLSYIYSVNPQLNELNLIIPESIRWLGFF